eukprot:maker-scaffold_43-snap-gene-1.32-mRNA-1 protein AED:0.04 eAED:0.04 QI:18/1/0.5/1/1/1/2/0/387
MSHKKENMFNFKAAEKTLLFWSCLQCFSFFQLCEFVVSNWRSIDFYKFKARIAANALRTLINSVASFIEAVFYAKTVAKQEIHSSPVFILGHFRSGTTLLLNLLTLDKDHFSFATTFQTAAPSSFLIMDRVKNFVESSIEATRPMDNMALGVDMPQEDEIGLIGLSITSPYFATILPSEFNKYKKYFYLENLKKEKEIWVERFKYFLKKATYQNVKKNKANRLVLKSPLHTARVEILNEIFPDAKYVYIVRNPYDVFKSTVNLYNKLFAYSFLETPSEEVLLEVILTQYEILLKKYFKAKEDGILVEGKNLVEIKFEELSNNMVENVQEVYTGLDLPNWDEMRKLVQMEEKKLSGYKKNRFNELDPELKELVYNRWKLAFDVFGYEK